MRGRANKTMELIRYARRLLAADHPQTLRQLHYAIFSRREIAYENCKADYTRLSRATSMARRGYRADELAGLDDTEETTIPGHWMIDETRQPETANVWADTTAYIDAVKSSYRRDNWQEQQHHCEVWSEKATVLGSVRPVAAKWGVSLRVCHGFGSTGMADQVGRFFESITKPITIFFLGDHDPSGHSIESDIHKRCQASTGFGFRMVRLAIHADDIRRFKLPPQRIKMTDSRSAAFKKKYGADAATVELDALPAAELRRRVEDAVTGLIDHEQWKRQEEIQDLELTCIAEFADRLKHLPQLGAQS